MKSMELFLILVLVAGGTHALSPVDETTCSLTKNTWPCSALLEGTVYIQVMANASGHEMKCLKVLPSGTITVFNLKKGRITTDEKFSNRLLFIINNGTLKITNVRRNDSGQYRAEVFNSEGVREKNIHFTLDVKDNNRVEGVETYCDGRQDGSQCYGALGGTVDIQLMDSSSEIFRYQLMKDSFKILNVRNNKVLLHVTERRFPFFPSNGTFRINNLSRTDAGNYTLQTFDSEGKSSGERTLKLFIQAPVSSVLLVSECLSQGEMRVSCSSEGGDSPQYSWTLDGRTLTDAELLSGNNEGNNITLNQHVSGHLVCSVRNNVSNVSKGQNISTCGILPLIGGVLLALIILLVMGLAVICAQRKKQSYKTTKPKGQNQRDHLAVYRRNDSQYEEEDEHVEHIVGLEVESEEEVEPELEVETEVEVKPEVVYSQVFKFLKRPQQTDPRGIECLYAKVHKIR
ncbi:uncharacterized protein LOC115787440 isoform X2 [Archocentrus centrarchus]|uniref:uncharacterized protein LOC115787440 isoform X2 n=1 Tax=Archocentrus centrarchus TaxID=63155 RepID=UPI0011E9F19A|nr:uncharacterized protein LOC115787440 isoform X2 [Archocentrus centrarchus]